MDVLAKESGGTEAFRAEIKKYDSRELKRKRDTVSTEHCLQITKFPFHFAFLIKNHKHTFFIYWF
uniref:Uncharacterized protein n=1 Tax=Astyanax mexicanus TaxID=7994 RepID=A0A8B9GTG1_ASTMX